MQAAVAHSFDTAIAPVVTLHVRSETALLRDHEKLIRHVARAFLGSGLPLDDLLQEGRLAFLTAARSFRADRGASLWTYAFKFVMGAMLSACNDECEREKSRTGEEALTAEESATVSAEHVSDCRELLKLDTLDPTEWRIVMMRAVEDVTFRDITRELGLSSFDKTERVYHAAIAKLRSYVEGSK